MMTQQQRQGIIIAITLFLALFLIWGGAVDTASVFFPDILKDFGWSRARLSSITAVAAIVGGIGVPIYGWLLDRVEARYVMAVGATTVGFSFIAASRAHSYDMLLACRVVTAVGMDATAFLPAAFVMSNWFGERRGLAMALTFSGASLGGAGMAQVAAYFVRHGGWRIGYVAVAMPMLLLMVPLILLNVRSRPRREGQVEGERRASVYESVTTLAGIELREAVRTRSLWMLCLASTLFAFAVFGLSLHLVAYLIGSGFSSAGAANVVSMLFIATTIGKLAAGFYADRVSPRLVLAGIFASGGIGVVLLMGVGSLPLPLAAGYVIFGAGAASAPTVLLPMVTVQSLGLKSLGSVLGISGLFSTLGLALGPVVGGRIFDVTGSYHFALVLFASCWFCASLATLGCLPLEAEQARLASSRRAAA